MGQVEQKDWSEIKQFKDPVYGYIPVSRAYVKKLIDTQMMQRIKGVAQTGFRPVFSSATHDRFSHSLGVYKFGMEMYDSLGTKLYAYVKDICVPKWGIEGEGIALLAELEGCLRHWKKLLAIGCLLHDIGHPIQSHGFEFLYDDPYLDVTYDPTTPVSVSDTGVDPEECKRIYKLFKDFTETGRKTPEGNLRSVLLKLFQKKEALYDKDYYIAPLPGNPHERMSAYYIFKDEQLRGNIEELIRASRKKAGLNGMEKEIDQDICFIARMIIGWEYPAPEQLAFQSEPFFASIKNCVIHILNGTIDADGIDYLIRNSYAAGYDTSKIDSARLCNAYTAYAKNFVLYPAFAKSALSILEGYMSARNFEPKWLYSHHKVVYADILTKQLYKFITWYLTDRTMLYQSVRSFLKYAPSSALVCKGVQNFGGELLVRDEKKPVGLSAKMLFSHMEQWSYPFYTYLLAPCRGYNISSYYFNRSSDADMEALFHWMSSELTQYADEGAEKAYIKYKEQLKKNIVDKLRNDPLVKFPTKNLRILLAEDCFEKLEQPDEKVCAILRGWIRSGNSCTAREKVDSKDKNSDKLMKLFQQTQGIGNHDKWGLLEYWLDQYMPLLSQTDFENFMRLLEEYQTRCYRGSLWKSQPEYQLFLKDCAGELGISSDDVNRYMDILISQGMEGRGFSVYDGKVARAIRAIPEQYQDQFFYQPEDIENPLKRVTDRVNSRTVSATVTVDPLKKGTEIAQKWASSIFTKTEAYDFSRNSLVVKYYRIKSKRFNKINLLFGERPVPLEEVFPYHKSSGIFPYFYYNDDSKGKLEDILCAFQEKFINFCREYRESEVRSENVRTGKSHMFRDAVYGDIEMTENFYAVVCTQEFQRLRRIRQLAAADRSFPNATHTRLAHSLGTWYVMRLILDHFKQRYDSNPQLKFSEADRNCALLAALLHDLGHGPYSHTVEAVFGIKHEDMTHRIILNPDTEVHQVIEERFGSGTCKRVCELLGGASPTENPNGIDRIYHSLISGQLDADRIDYLLRDNAACWMAFGHIDIQQLIASMRLMPDYGDEQGGAVHRLCFDDRYLPAIEQFIYARYQMYKNIYHDPQKQLYEQIFERIFRQAFSLLDKVEEDETFSLLKEIKKKKKAEVSDYIGLDDERVNTLIKKWADGKVLKEGVSEPKLVSQASIIQLLCRAFLSQRPLFKRVDLGSHRRQYDLLAKRIGRQLGKEDTSFSKLEEICCAFIYIQGNDYAYKMDGPEKDQKTNIVLCNMNDGTTSDYAHQSLFRDAHGSTKKTILETDYCYLFFSEELLREDCVILGKDKMADAVKQTLESATPRRHIEIEKKFYCAKEKLEKAEQYLDKQCKEASKIENLQTDTYFDFRANGIWMLENEQCSLRCRKKSDGYIFTVKIPTESLNYRSPNQFARHEYELQTTEPYITDEVWQFLIDTLDICGKGDLRKGFSKECLEKRLVIHNQRITYRLEGSCEICLDKVDYETANGKPIGTRDHQIEIELLGEPEAWAELEVEVITPLVQDLGEDSLKFTSKSKLEKGLELLRNREKGTAMETEPVHPPAKSGCLINP